MKVFVAGATGVIGRRLVPQLQAAGQDVAAMTRSEEHAAGLRAAGVEALVADAFDADRVHEVLASAKPEIVVHVLTSIPKAVDPRKLEEQFAENDRLRVEGTKNLVAAAEAAGVRRLIAESISFAYAPVGSWVKTERDPLYLDAPAPMTRLMRAVATLEETVTGASFEGVVLRFGFLYGPGTAYAPDGSIAELVRKRRFPIVGDGAGVFSFVHVDDAAAAVAIAVAAVAAAAAVGGPAGIYNIVDDEPAPSRTWLPVYAASIGAPRPLRVPELVGRLGGGAYGVYLMTQVRGASNRLAGEVLGWRPRRNSWRTGFAEAAGPAP